VIKNGKKTFEIADQLTNRIIGTGINNNYFVWSQGLMVNTRKNTGKGYAMISNGNDNTDVKIFQAYQLIIRY
jgi:hypothetical protein